MTWRSVTSAGVVVGLCGGALAAASALQPDARTAASDATVREFLRSADLACTGRGSADEDASVAAASVPDTRGQDVPGRVRVDQGRRELAHITRPGATATAPATGSATVHADGGLAPGLITAEVLVDPRGEGKGLASAPCPPATAESWLLGAGAQPGQHSVVVLTNPTASDSLVDITAFTKGGPIETAGDDGITVPAGATVEVRVDKLARRSPAVALRVRTRVGLVAAILRDEQMNGLTPMGADLASPAGEPARHVVLAGVPGGAGSRELHLIAPRGSGTVRLTALTENGPLPLLAGQPVPVKEGAVTVLDLTDEISGRVAALRITGDVEVLAGMRATTAVDESVRARREAAVAAAERAVQDAKGAAQRQAAQERLTRAETANAIDPGEDFAWLGAAPPLSGRAAVTGLSRSLDATLLVTAVGGPAQVDVSLLPADPSGARPQRGRPVRVAADTTVAVPVRAPAATYSAIVARTAGTGIVHVGHVQLDDGRSLTGYALAPLRVWIPATRALPRYTQ